MSRFFTLVVSGILFIMLSSFFSNEVTIRTDMPDVIEAGTEITVNVSINKGKMSGFARFQQELPYGFTAISGNSANADFTFQDQKVRLIWLRLPDDNEISVSYKIIANERLTGKIDLNGRFSYIDNNVRKYADLQPRTIAVNPSPNVDPAMVVDVKDYAKTGAFELSVQKASRVACLRQEPVWMQENNVFLVTLLVNKDAITKFAKIEEKIPTGYTAVNVDSKGGVFTYKDNTAKFVWMNLPTEPYFTVTYKLIPDEGLVVNPSDMSIEGTFSCMTGDKTTTANVSERKERLAGLTPEQVNRILADVVPVVEETPVLVASVEKLPVSVASVEKPAQKTPVSEPVSLKKPVSRSSDTNDMLMPESGMYYRVQIAAGRKPVNTQRFFRRYKLEYSVLKESHDGWFKYSIGSFPTYKDARDYKAHLSNTTPLNHSFIAAYNNGQRITVQEALMALNQKWYE